MLTLATNERDGAVVLIWDVKTQICRLMRDGKREGPDRVFDVQAVLDWMRACGVNANGDVQVEAASVVACTENAARTISSVFRGFRRQQSSAGGSSRLTYPVQAMCGVLWLGWVAGLVWLWRRSRRAWRVAVIRRVGEVETGMAQVDDWDGASLRTCD